MFRTRFDSKLWSGPASESKLHVPFQFTKDLFSRTRTSGFAVTCIGFISFAFTRKEREVERVREERERRRREIIFVELIVSRSTSSAFFLTGSLGKLDCVACTTAREDPFICSLNERTNDERKTNSLLIFDDHHNFALFFRSFSIHFRNSTFATKYLRESQKRRY